MSLNAKTGDRLLIIWKLWSNLILIPPWIRLRAGNLLASMLGQTPIRAKICLIKFINMEFSSGLEHSMPMLRLMKMIQNQLTKRKVVNSKELAIVWTYWKSLGTIFTIGSKTAINQRINKHNKKTLTRVSIKPHWPRMLQQIKSMKLQGKMVITN